MKLAKSLKEFIGNEKKIWLYGMAAWGRHLQAVMKCCGISVAGFLKSSNGHIICYQGSSVCGFEKVFSKKYKIILATDKINSANEMKNLLHDNNVLHDNIFYPFEHDDVKDMLFDYWKKVVRIRESKKRKKYDIFDYKSLSNSMSFMYCCHSFKDMVCFHSSVCYGHDKVIEKIYPFIKKKKQIKYYHILHAAYFFPEFTREEINPPGHNIFCMSDYVLKKANVPNYVNIYSVGCYIQYVKPLLTMKKISLLKKRFGKTLLVAPIHGLYGGKDVFNYDVWLKYIDYFAKEHNFKKIIICLGPESVNNGDDKHYSDKKYKIFTAGHTLDIFFLNRLKTALLLSDMVVSNDYSMTLMGYALKCGRPFVFHDMENDYLIDYSKEGLKWAVDLGTEGIDENSIYRYEKLKAQVKRLFGDYQEKITVEQKKFVRKYWGE